MSEITLEESLEDNDWALIIDNEGNLKGMFIPQGLEDEPVPDVILQIVSDYFGMDLDDAETIH